MTFDPEQHHRRSIRLPGYDYAQAGAYFVTIVCRNRDVLFSDERFRTICERAWLWLAERHPHVELDEYVIMPNHLHGIIVIRDDRRGGSRTAPTDPTTRRKPLGRLIGAFKTVSTKRINIIRETPGAPVWQRNYYEHVIRGERDLDRVRRYIAENPLRWGEDPENPMLVAARATGGRRGSLLHDSGDHRGSPLRTDGRP